MNRAELGSRESEEDLGPTAAVIQLSQHKDGCPHHFGKVVTIGHLTKDISPVTPERDKGVKVNPSIDREEIER